MQLSRRTSTIIVVILVAALGWMYFSKGTKREKPKPPVFNGPTKDTSLYFNGIPPEGKGGDPLLNLQKNRTTIPEKLETYSVHQILAIPSTKLEGTNDNTRKYWSDEAKQYAAKWESKGVVVEGYLVKARESGKESANGNSDKYRDYHLWIVQEKNEPRSSSIIAEVTPRIKATKPSWKIENFVKLSNKRTKVRVTGWLLWDEEHGDEVGKSRGSQWEVHPMTKFEIFEKGEWKEY
ncbi:MAG TPA: hypothetical protein VIX80_00340 [Candidatus Kapabacteria bacterium]